MAIQNYTTKISPSKTVAEIQDTLVKHGAREINQSFNDEGLLVAIAFRMDVNGTRISFLLTPTFDGVLRSMQRDKVPKGLQTMEQAVRVAWRIEKDWLEAQMAKVEAGLATPAQLLLSYAVTKDGNTFFNQLNAGEIKKLLQ